MRNSYNLTHLEELEYESIYVIREVAAQFERPALLFSGGKDPPGREGILPCQTPLSVGTY